MGRTFTPPYAARTRAAPPMTGRRAIGGMPVEGRPKGARHRSSCLVVELLLGVMIAQRPLRTLSASGQQGQIAGSAPGHRALDYDGP